MSTPYAGSSGWSGTDTSQERAEDADLTGKTAHRQSVALNALRAAGPRGLTVHELDRLTGWHHHGTTSGCLSVLHKDSQIARLTERRDKCRVYVHLDYLNGREHDSQGRRAPEPVVVEPVVTAPDPLRMLLHAWLVFDTSGWSRASREPRRFIDALRRHLDEERQR